MNLERLLVATKFAPPRIGARTIVRGQLLEDLRRERDRKLVLVPGSAGFGKTVLLAQWRRELMKDGFAVAWLSLSPDERQLASFSTHLFAALARLGRPLDVDPTALADTRGFTDAAVASIVNGLAAIEEDLYLIVDDYHHVDDPLAHALLQKIVEFSPGNLHTILASRAVPPLSIARLRVMGQVGEIDCAALPFDLGETRAFLEQTLGAGGVNADELNQIQELTHGWPACVQLVSIMLKHRPERRTTLHDLAWQSSDLQNYLSEDVVARLPRETAEFMEAVSICRRFSVELAAAVSGNADAPALLRRIEEENLLISRVEFEDRSPWYRFHPLFAEFLSARLQRRGQEAVDVLHRRASVWCADRGLVIEAVRHAGLGHDLDSAVDIFERTAPASWRLGHFGPMLHLLHQLPTETMRTHPRLLLLASLATALTGRPARAAILAEQFRESGGAGTPAGAFRLALLEALIASQQDDTDRTRRLLEPFGPADATTSLERYVFLSIFGYSLVACGRFEDAYRLLDDNPAPIEERDEDLALVTESCRSPWRLLEGEALDALRIKAPAYARATAALGPQSIGASLMAISMACLCYELNRTDEASQLIASRSHSIATLPTEPMINAAMCRARLLAVRDSPVSALSVLGEQIGLFRSMGLDRGVAYALAEQGRLALAAGDGALAADATRRLREIAARHADASGFLADIVIVDGLAQARLALHQGDVETARKALAAASEAARRQRRGGMAVRLDVLMALALNAGGRGDEAATLLAATIERAAPMGLVRTIVDEGEDVGVLLRRLPQETLSKAAADYLNDLIAAFGAAAPANAGLAGKDKPPLTPRELEILQLVAAGMSNKRIALTLNITLETVKWNLKNVFLKLSVSSRYDAMIWARHQGLIA